MTGSDNSVESFSASRAYLMFLTWRREEDGGAGRAGEQGRGTGEGNRAQTG